MRSLMFLLVLVLFCSLQMTSSAPSALDAANSKCCFGSKNVKIPVKLVKSYSWTTSDCPRRAIVFQMISGREICVDPETTWASGHVAIVDKRTTSKTTTTTTVSTAKTQSPTV
ncbi:monocyte chemotactic protein 1B isoform X1 [Ctenopharyngodon idella]|uniref:monocyte chemotactic protein 1B isoform X1 n=1 Tax=Ctenopharyngodon idella TaxID=7959 RepID=UPI00222F4079|nr:monocyte chemotactic protein 1B isoform X1 [Ctenopharyngodon idella]XP_051740294.1 monocyte chemotactic protein 1B isoform X1 [Ctenopharyngodon idella]XP_051740295.1 monocyte chemotactic protein 1B isoform X1 [Ctenopharyngodon idella]